MAVGGQLLVVDLQHPYRTFHQRFAADLRHREDNLWYHDHREVCLMGSAVRSGEAVYPPGIDQVFIYPPASAVLFYTPLSFLGFPAMVVIVCLIAFASYLAAVALSVA